jgi:hypothetical protein
MKVTRISLTALILSGSAFAMAAQDPRGHDRVAPMAEPHAILKSIATSTSEYVRSATSSSTTQPEAVSRPSLATAGNALAAIGGPFRIRFG